MAEHEKTMFEIYRERDYNRRFRYIFYTELEEHEREREIARAANGVTVYTGFLADETRDAARKVVEGIVDELNDMDMDDSSPLPNELERRLSPYLVT